MAAHMRYVRWGSLVLIGFTALAAGVSVSGQSGATVVFENARVRVFRTAGTSLAGVAHGPGVVVPLLDGPTRKAGDAYWADDAAVPRDVNGANPGPLIVVEPKAATAGAPPPIGSKPGEAEFVGMSFRTLFENEKLTAIRARMDVNAREGFHTHASDTLVVHLSGGAIEDTAEGTTKVNRWKPGDVEFESRGSSHSARNIGAAVDVVLVALKP
jgi:quercetin dioxygenase-like cupin family protein